MSRHRLKKTKGRAPPRRVRPPGAAASSARSTSRAEAAGDDDDDEDDEEGNQVANLYHDEFHLYVPLKVNKKKI